MQRLLSITVTMGVILTLANSTVWAGQRVVEEWVARYDGSIMGTDKALALAVDGLGNVYVTGYSDGNATDRDYATIKYNPDGNELWVARYNGPGNDSDRARAVAVDTLGNAYVTGDSIGDGTWSDYTTIKYGPDSNEPLWVARYNGPANHVDSAFDMALDAEGNVYITGGSYSGDTNYMDYATIKYDPNGNELWVARYNRTRRSGDIATSIAVDDLGNVYITGHSGTREVECYVTVKYDSGGNKLWATSCVGSGEAIPFDIAVDDLGNVYVTGMWATVKYDPNGNELWSKEEGPAIEKVGIAVDGVGNVYVAGRSGWDYAVIKYDPNGNELWRACYDGPVNGQDYAYAIAMDDLGNVYVTGGSDGNDTSDDYATIKYGPDSNEPLWVARYNGPANVSDSAGAITVDIGGNVYVTGYSGGSYATLKYLQCTQVGDIDCDKDVDFRDFVMLGRRWLESGCGECGWADLDDDKDVDFKDLNKFTQNWLEGKI